MICRALIWNLLRPRLENASHSGRNKYRSGPSRAPQWFLSNVRPPDYSLSRLRQLCPALGKYTAPPKWTGKKEGGKKEQLKAPCSVLMCGTKQMEMTAVHNHLRFRHGGSCWEQIKLLKETVKDFRSLAETRLSRTYRKVHFETIVTEIRGWRFCSLSQWELHWNYITELGCNHVCHALPNTPARSLSDLSVWKTLIHISAFSW